MKLSLTLLQTLIVCCLFGQTSLPTIEFQQIKIIPNDFTFENTIVGGISGIECCAKENEYLIVADKPNARYYTIGIEDDLQVEFKSLHYLQPQKGENESIRIHPITKELFLADERNKKTCVFKHPANSSKSVELNIPKKFKKMSQNSGFEGMTFSPDGQYLYLGLEWPLRTEVGCGVNEKVSGITRILQLDLNDEENAVAEYGYPLLNLDKLGRNGNGLTEILHWKEQLFLVLERSYFPELRKNNIRIYLIDLAKADDIQNKNICDLGTDTKLLKPQLLFDFETAIQAGKLKRVDNAEGMCWSTDKKSLFIVSDNNFNRAQETQIIQLSFEE